MDLAAARDVAIIILCIINIITLIVLAVLLWVLVQLVRNGVIPLMNSAKRTVNTVEGTANYLSRTAISPAVRIAGVAAAATTFFRAIRSRPKKGGR